ncbi:hypothetical protein PAL_GLEAN10004682 [Pteropus alecto]|uniref:Uncharacterized protein n=1 Tax=Pteropus alecto TaxID=9402 RepID=L5KZE4_PTEAL|nr:hypothetical protein PAL_GLEAN10004682 [Pteropus alecto]
MLRPVQAARGTGGHRRRVSRRASADADTASRGGRRRRSHSPRPPPHRPRRLLLTCAVADGGGQRPGHSLATAPAERPLAAPSQQQEARPQATRAKSGNLRPSQMLGDSGGGLRAAALHLTDFAEADSVEIRAPEMQSTCVWPGAAALPGGPAL